MSHPQAASWPQCAHHPEISSYRAAWKGGGREIATGRERSKNFRRQFSGVHRVGMDDGTVGYFSIIRRTFPSLKFRSLAHLRQRFDQPSFPPLSFIF